MITLMIDKITGPNTDVRLECLDDGRCNRTWVKCATIDELHAYVERATSALCYNSFNVYVHGQYVGGTEV